MTIGIYLDKSAIRRFLLCAAQSLEEARSELSALDGEVGDGDHGASMADGFHAAMRGFDLCGSENLPDCLRAAGRAFLQAVGATVGPLYASGFIGAAGRADPDGIALASLISGFSEGIAGRGKAAPGDCTMMDVWEPAAHAAAAAGVTDNPMQEVLDAAGAGLEATRSMVASRGRAARLGSRALGRIDPGAQSAFVILTSLAGVVRETDPRE